MSLATRMDNQNGTSIVFETFRWKIEKFSKQNTKKLQSKSFRIRGYKWYCLMDLNSKVLCYLLLDGSKLDKDANKFRLLFLGLHLILVVFIIN